ncbi:MAG: hypothetical protein ACYYK0_01670 [Candidatus Eutrophobiaceae bacterium]
MLMPTQFGSDVHKRVVCRRMTKDGGAAVSASRRAGKCLAQFNLGVMYEDGTWCAAG